MFIEINEVGRYPTKNTDKNGNTIYNTIIEGKVLINIDLIRCVSLSGFDWEYPPENHVIQEGSQRYCVYFDKDRYVYTDIESYNKIKQLVLNNDNNMVIE